MLILNSQLAGKIVNSLLAETFFRKTESYPEVYSP